MRILVDDSGYTLANYGDVAMLQVTVRRIAELWPDAYIEVITSDATELSRFCPGTHPLLIPNLKRWHQIRCLADRQIDAISDWAHKWKSGMWHRFLGLEPNSLERKWAAYVDAAKKADLVIASGGGYVNDVFAAHGVGVLSTLEAGIRAGKPAVIFSHGFEPMTNPAVLAKAQAVLPALELIGCREKVFSPSTLQALGIASDKVVVTGDDSIEIVHAWRATGARASSGRGLGVNLRVSWYAGVDARMREAVRAVLQNGAHKHESPLVSLPISMRSPCDADSIRPLLAGYVPIVDGGGLGDPLDIVRRVATCRVVVTGSYHAAVFALAQGIPAICLGQSAYYMHKFEGLRGQFGDGCYLLSLDAPDFERALAETIDTAWERAEIDEPHLLAEAKCQLELSRQAYRRMYDLVCDRRAFRDTARVLPGVA